jgi:coenzyme F420-reducing hydrogenase alpha subunit
LTLNVREHRIGRVEFKIYEPPRLFENFLEGRDWLLWHRYTTDAQGRTVSARIVPPTSQNQARIEADLRASLEACGLAQPAETLRRRAETVIRNYDPCISCATHFIRLRIEEAGSWINRT